MTAGMLHGAPVTTVDLAVVRRRSPENVARLLRALARIDAVYRHDPRRLRPGESHLVGPGHQLLATTHGDLDCLGAIDQDRGYEELLDQTVVMSLGGGLHPAAQASGWSASTWDLWLRLSGRGASGSRRERAPARGRGVRDAT